MGVNFADFWGIHLRRLSCRVPGQDKWGSLLQRNAFYGRCLHRWTRPGDGTSWRSTIRSDMVVNPIGSRSTQLDHMTWPVWCHGCWMKPPGHQLWGFHMMWLEVTRTAWQAPRTQRMICLFGKLSCDLQAIEWSASWSADHCKRFPGCLKSILWLEMGPASMYLHYCTYISNLVTVSAIAFAAQEASSHDFFYVPLPVGKRKRIEMSGETHEGTFHIMITKNCTLQIKWRLESRITSYCTIQLTMATRLNGSNQSLPMDPWGFLRRRQSLSAKLGIPDRPCHGEILDADSGSWKFRRSYKRSVCVCVCILWFDVCVSLCHRHTGLSHNELLVW